ncbi:unnamed protein product [Cylindrotheca closterium]|uniref:Uncharacterized protein n=1 Tax=Cylindrotheca closterium TaxID=2856 RepID=A0AAD2CBR3_9STRA|nr:unnamed protein product [Cylindrotheca closterium]
MQLLPYSIVRTLPLLGVVCTAFHNPQHHGIYHVQEISRLTSPTTSLNLATQDSSDSDNPENDKNSEGMGVKNKGLLRLAKLSLEDYQWRQALFKSSEAERKVEESLARMMGDEPSYVRPMDASSEKIGPLGLLEKSSVDWLLNVIDEEARRAEKIVGQGGALVRPYEATTPEGELGPLGMVEKNFVDFLESIRQSERIRSQAKVLRPKDLDESQRGPLGKAELEAVEKINDIFYSEKVRAQQSWRRGRRVRPIDVPGPLGDFEMAVLDVVKAEQLRKREKEENARGFALRPKDSKVKGPLGELEQQAVEAVRKLTDEERYRLRSVKRFLDEKRPMEQDRMGVLGFVETVMVGIIRAPILMFQIIARVKELLDSEPLNEEDEKILQNQKRKEDKQ